MRMRFLKPLLYSGFFRCPFANLPTHFHSGFHLLQFTMHERVTNMLVASTLRSEFSITVFVETFSFKLVPSTNAQTAQHQCIFHVAQLIWQPMEVLQVKFMTVIGEFSFHKLCLTGQTCGTTPFHMPYYAILFIEGNTLICKSYMKSNESCRAPNFPCTIIAAEMIRCREGIRQSL